MEVTSGFILAQRWKVERAQPVLNLHYFAIVCYHVL